MTKKTLHYASRVILASSSERRKNMLQVLGIPFQKVVSDIEEKWSRSANPRQIAMQLALEKSKAVVAPESLVIGMDTLVVAGKRILGKPAGSNEAESMLRLLSGRMHRVITGLALTYGSQTVTDYAETNVYFRKLSAKEIDLDTGSGYSNPVAPTFFREFPAVFQVDSDS